jgi:hypothetical protein
MCRSAADLPFQVCESRQGIDIRGWRLIMRFALSSVFMLCLVAACLSMGAEGTTLPQGTVDQKSKYSIREIDRKLFQPVDNISLWNRALEPGADQADKNQVVDLYTEMAKTTPPKGDNEQWKKRVGTILAFAKEYASEKDPDKAAAVTVRLVLAANCNACHKAHR